MWIKNVPRRDQICLRTGVFEFRESEFQASLLVGKTRSKFRYDTVLSEKRITKACCSQTLNKSFLAPRPK